MSLRQLRQQSLFDSYDQLTPGAGRQSEYGYGDEGSNPSSPYTPGPTGLDQVGAQQDSYKLGSEPESQTDSPIKTPTIDPVGAPGASKGASFQDYIKMMNEGYTPDYTSRDRLNKLLDDAPTRQAPGWGRALIAAGMSVKAQDPIATAEKVMYAPYMRDVEEWKTRADPYYKAADLENRQNVNERTLMQNAATAYTAAERSRITEENNQMRNAVAVTRNNIQQAKNNGLKVTKDGDRFVGHDPQGRQYELGSSRGMTREEEINALGEFKIAAAEALAGGAMARTRAGAQGLHQTPDGRTWTMDDNGKPVEVKYPEKGGGPPASTTGRITRPTSSGTTEPNQLEQNRITQSKIQTMRTDYPETKKWMEPDGKGGYRFKARPVAHPDTWWPNDHVPESDVEEYDAARRIIDPNYVPPSGKGIGPSGAETALPNSNNRPVIGGSNTPVDTEGNPKAGNRPIVPQGPIPPKKNDVPLAGIPQGRIPVYGKNGAIVGHIPNTPEQRAAAKAQGYTVK